MKNKTNINKGLLEMLPMGAYGSHFYFLLKPFYNILFNNNNNINELFHYSL